MAGPLDFYPQHLNYHAGLDARPEEGDAPTQDKLASYFKKAMGGGDTPTLNARSFGAIRHDDTPTPDDLLWPRVIVPGGLTLVAGAPKAGKSDLIIHLMAHMAAGYEFLGLRPPRPMRIFYLQAELEGAYLRERLRNVRLPEEVLLSVDDNLVCTDRFFGHLNVNGVEELIKAIHESFPISPPDLIVLDPLANIFNGGSENSNDDMMTFLTKLRTDLLSKINPGGAMMIIHHTAKINKKDLQDNPFNAIRGASAIRGTYDTGMMLLKPEEESTERWLYFERRNATHEDDLGKKVLKRTEGVWSEIPKGSPEALATTYQGRLNSNHTHKKNIILDTIREEADKGNLFTMEALSVKLEGTSAMGASAGIRKQMRALAMKGHIRFTSEAHRYYQMSLPPGSGFMVLPEMRLTVVNPMGKTGLYTFEVKPTHYMHSQTGRIFEVDDNLPWIAEPL